MGGAKSFQGSDIRDQLAGIKEHPCVTGTITIDADRNAVKPIVVLKIAGGKAMYQTTYRPPF